MELQAAVGKLVAVDVFAGQAARDLVLLQYDALPVVGERQLVALPEIFCSSKN